MQLKRLTLSVMLMGASAAVMASGYHFGTQSVSSQSTANASAAEAADASTIFYNAAGMTKLEGTNFSGAINLVMPSVKYSNASATYPTPAAFGNKNVSGVTSGTITDDLVAVPHLYVTHKLNEKVAVGLGVYVPFASSTEYERDSVLRYNLNATSLKTIDINPTVAFQLNDQHSVAVGVIAQHAEASLRQYANFGYALAGGNAGLPGSTAGNGAADGFADVDGEDWGFGYNLAWLWDINDAARVGVSYRSQIEHKLKGTAKWAKPAAGYAALNAAGFKDVEDATVEIDTPESLSVHGMYKLNPRVNLFGDVTWTKHSRFDKARLVYANSKTGQGDTTYLSPAWKDTYKVALGASYQYTDALQLRAGVAFDKSPVPDDDHRLATMPDNDRTWFSIGGKYDFSKQSSIDFAYSYIMIKDAKANVDGTCTFQGVSTCVSSQTKGTADYKSSAQIVGVQYNYRF